jgi:hypothetical protein
MVRRLTLAVALSGILAGIFVWPLSTLAHSANALLSTPQHVIINFQDGHIVLSWDAVQGADSYSIYRGNTSQGEGAKPYKTGIVSTTFTNTLVTPGTVYYYQITAVSNNGGESPRSDEAFATAPNGVQSTPTTVTATSPSVSTPTGTNPLASGTDTQLGHTLFVLITFIVALIVGSGLSAGLSIFRRRSQAYPQGKPPVETHMTVRLADQLGTGPHKTTPLPRASVDPWAISPIQEGDPRAGASPWQAATPDVAQRRHFQYPPLPSAKSEWLLDDQPNEPF